MFKKFDELGRGVNFETFKTWREAVTALEPWEIAAGRVIVFLDPAPTQCEDSTQLVHLPIFENTKAAA